LRAASRSASFMLVPLFTATIYDQDSNLYISRLSGIQIIVEIPGGICNLIHFASSRQK